MYRILAYVPNGVIGSALSGFPVPVDLSRLTPLQWSLVTSVYGYDIEARDLSNTIIPFFAVNCNKNKQRGVLWVKLDLTTLANNYFYICIGGIPRSISYRRYYRNQTFSVFNNVNFWDDEFGYFDAVGDNPIAEYSDMSGPWDSENASCIISPNVLSHQGIYFDGTYWYTTDNNYIRKWLPGSPWIVVAFNNNPCGDIGYTVNHIGDPDGYNGFLWVPCTYWDGGAVHNNKRIARFLLSDLSFAGSYDIQTYGGEATLTINNNTGRIYAADGYGGSPTTIVVYDANNDCNYLGSFTVNVAGFNGMQLRRSKLYIHSNMTDKYIYKYNLETSTLEPNHVIAPTGTQAEGLAMDDDYLYALYSTGIGVGYIHRVIPLEEWPGWDSGVGSVCFFKNINTIIQRYVVSGAFSQWTVGVSVIPAALGNHMIFSYGLMPFNVASCESFGLSSTGNRFFFGNSTDGNTFNPTVISANTLYRLHFVKNGTTSTTLYVDGVGVSKAPCAARPVGAGVFAISLGNANDGGGTAPWYGTLGFATFYNGILSADWMAAERLSISNNPVFVILGAMSRYKKPDLFFYYK